MSAILVLGEPGSGKSRAIKNLDPKKTVIIKPNNKPLPFPGWQKNYGPTNMFMMQTFEGVYNLIIGWDPKEKKKTGKGINDAPQITTVVIEDFTHYMTKKVIDDANITGYQKWTEMGVKVFNNIIQLEALVRPTLDIILIGHVTATQDAAGNVEIGLQTAGKLLDQVVKIPSYFTYILHTVIDYSSGEQPIYQFQTNRDDRRLAKTPEKMFPLFIDNDYALVLDRIHKYNAGEIDFEAEEAAKTK